MPDDTNRNVVDIFRDLSRHLAADERSAKVTQQFRELKTNGDRVWFVYRLLDGYGLLPAFIADEKSDVSSSELRQLGNGYFKRKHDEQAVEFYTQSLSLAADKTENVAFAFANRSAVLFEKGMYRECLTDIERALEQGYPDNLKEKLLNRHEKAKSLQNKQAKLQYHQQLPTIPASCRHSGVDCASNCVNINYTEGKGRHIVADRDINIGEIIAVEKPYSCMLINGNFSHCHECLQLCYNPIPCHSCTHALYCSATCLREAQLHHQYECRILKTLHVLNLGKMELLPLRIALRARSSYQEIAKWPLGGEDKYRSDRYKEVHGLIGNTDKRAVSDLFEKACTGAVIYHLVKTQTDFFVGEEDESVFRELILRHIQTAACNFHEISEIRGVEHVEIGAGAYSFLSLFNHSCSPNVVRHCYGPVIVLRAIENIRKGEECFDNYGYHYALMNKTDRKNRLKQQYFFDCTCQVCMEDWPTLEQLPVVDTDIGISEEDLTALGRGDLDCVERVLQQVLPRMNELERVKPNRNHAEMQEVVKQCYASWGNKREAF